MNGGGGGVKGLVNLRGLEKFADQEGRRGRAFLKF
jgi:hypothetical protein